MSRQLICDGCKTPMVMKLDPHTGMARQFAVQGDLVAEIAAGFQLGEFHWCDSCARIAFRAVNDHLLRSKGWVGPS